MSHVSLHVYVLFAILVWLGVTRCFPRTIRVERLVLMPALMAVLALRSYPSLFPAASSGALAAGLVGLGSGSLLGMWHVRRWDVGIDRGTRSISLPGDGAMLVIIVATFVFEFAVHHGIEARASWLADPLAPTIVAGIWGTFVGMSTGRNLGLFRRYATAHRNVPCPSRGDAG